MKTPLLYVLFSLFSITLSAQQRQMPEGKATISGKIVDAADKSPLPGANVIFQSFRDSTIRIGTTSDGEGNFVLPNVRFGGYVMKVSYLGYQEIRRPMRVMEEKIDLGVMDLAQDTKTLGDVVVQDRAIKVQQMGDTTQYNAGAVKVIKDANAEDLVSKMSGIQVQNGEVKAQGETVRRVTLDGREYFGDDATAALRALPSEVVDRVQVFDQQSEQARFTGFDDGNSQKTLNIVTKQNRQNGQFGRLFAGYGTDARYQSGGNVSYFNKDQKVTVVLQGNNVNQQNFSSVDLLGLQAQGGGGGRMGGGMRPGGGPPGGFGGGGGPGANDFFVSQSRGVSTSQAIGINYADDWGKKWKSSASLFVNHSDNLNESALNRLFVSNPSAEQSYDEDADVNTIGFTNRFNARMEYTIDKDNSLVIQPRFNTQNNELSNVLTGVNQINTIPVSQTQTNYSTDGKGYNGSMNVLWRHRFTKPGRTISVNMRADVNNQNSSSLLLSTISQNNVLLQSLDQDGSNQTNGTTYSSNITVTELLGKKGQLQLSYEPRIALNTSDRETFSLDPVAQTYTVLDSTLSSLFDNTVMTQRAGATVRYRLKKGSISLGANAQYTELDAKQDFPFAVNVNRTFVNVLPTAMLQYRITPMSNFFMFYRTNPNVPSLNQLQSVVNNTNPLQLSSGNPDLKQEVSHFIVSRYNIANPRTSRNFFVFALFSTRQNFIGNSTFLASADTTLPGNISLRRGAQYSRPENLSGQYTARTFATYSFPVDLIKSNLTVNAGFNYNRTPGLINNQKNISTTKGLNSGFVLTSNISDKFDFTLSLDGTYNIVDNRLQPALNSNYYQQNSSFKFNWIFFKGFFFETSVNNIYLTGLGADFDQNFVLWGGGIGKRVGKREQGELKLSVFDLLRQNDSVSRNITDVYIDDLRNNVLTRYVMMTFTYNLRNFTAAK